ncbi:MAG TPA: GTP cyclohydrolase II [Candidatus Poseidoniales archaeon]|nr:MAG: GTP cyclohydrolase II [Euryarchaeota archaeon TMED252]DAC08592.1 MAG TPA: GTP cyclohydrolase II [Candidatus Poseidoniales archaeon]HII20148.1 GTP cyclohydrolase II [Poseidonia sp.]
MESAPIHYNNNTPGADAVLPTAFGDFRIRAFRDPGDGKEHAILYVGDLSEGSPLVRVHSECLTGDAFHSLRCDCGPQLHASMKAIQERGHGAIAYMRQEGRGIGLYSKMQAYALQDTGMDTLDANLALGLPADARKYDFAAEMLYSMGIQSIELVTNNPDKRDQLTQYGIKISNRVPIIVGQCAENRNYMQTKGSRMGHILPSEV